MVPGHEVDCDAVGGADFCLTTTTPMMTAKDCATADKMEGFKKMGLTGVGCKTMEQAGQEMTICLCEGDLCNA